MKGALKFAVKNKYISENVMGGMERPKSKLLVDEEEYKAFTQEEMQTLFNAVEHPMWKAVITTMRYTGIRVKPLGLNGVISIIMP